MFGDACAAGADFPLLSDKTVIASCGRDLSVAASAVTKEPDRQPLPRERDPPQLHHLRHIACVAARGMLVRWSSQAVCAPWSFGSPCRRGPPCKPFSFIKRSIRCRLQGTPTLITPRQTRRGDRGDNTPEGISSTGHERLFCQVFRSWVRRCNWSKARRVFSGCLDPIGRVRP